MSAQFISKKEAGKVRRVDVSGNRIHGQYGEGGGMFRLIGPSNPAPYLDKFHDRSVDLWFKDASEGLIPCSCSAPGHP
jgi:hypothetical protein